MKKITSIIIILTTIFLFTGCVRLLTVDVDSIGSQPKQAKSYILSSGMPDITEKDLQFKEYSVYVNNALRDQGYSLSNFGDADIGILLSYGVGDPHTEFSLHSKPIYGQTGVTSSYTTGTINTFGNMASLNANTIYTPSYGVVGTKVSSSSITTYNKYVTLNAIDLKKYRLTREMESIWKITMTSDNVIKDLRENFPVMLGAGKEYIGVNTGKVIRVRILENDNRVVTVKNTK